jgi:hypothetical protein
VCAWPWARLLLAESDDQESSVERDDQRDGNPLQVDSACDRPSAVVLQRIGRIYRLGQNDPVDVFNLVTEYGIEARIAGLVSNKQALFSGLFDGTTDAVRFDGPASFTADIERLIEPIEVPEALGGEDAPEATGDTVELHPDAAAPSAEPALLAATEPAATEPAATEPAAPLLAPEPAAAIKEQVTADFLPVPALGVAQLLEKISVSRTPEGGMRIEAPPSAAAELSQLLTGLADLLQRASGARSE